MSSGTRWIGRRTRGCERCSPGCAPTRGRRSEGEGSERRMSNEVLGKRRTPRSSRIAASSRALGENSRRLPRTPSLELSVLPNGGGQCIDVGGKSESPRNEFTTSGAEGSRTPDLCSAIAALSQLSYSPALARACGEQISASSASQTETAPQSSGAAVTVTNLARRSALSSRRAVDAVVTAGSSDARSDERPRQLRLACGGAGVHHV